MKNYIKLSLFAVLLAGFSACSPDQGDEGYMNRLPTAFFNTGSGTLFVGEDTDNVFDVKLGVSEMQDENLTYVIEVDPSSVAVQDVDFTLETNTEFPANSIMSSFKVTGNFDTASIDGKLLVLNLVSMENARVVEKKQFLLNLVKSCPLEAPFTGNYVLTQTSPGWEPAGGAPLFGNNVVVTVSEVTDQPFSRKFTARFYPSLNLGNAPMPITFDLSCGTVEMSNVISTISCGAGLPPVEIDMTTAEPGTYDSADDSVITIVLFENSTGQCGDPGQQTTLVLTKQGA